VVIVLFWGEGEFPPYIIAYNLLNIILSFSICHVCVNPNDDVIVNRSKSPDLCAAHTFPV
jgi:hypothetical protein